MEKGACVKHSTFVHYAVLTKNSDEDLDNPGRKPPTETSRRNISTTGKYMSLTHCDRVSGAVACLPYAILVTMACTGPALAQAPRDLAFPGYSGFLNVPSATVLRHG